MNESLMLVCCAVVQAWSKGVFQDLYPEPLKSFKQISQIELMNKF